MQQQQDRGGRRASGWGSQLRAALRQAERAMVAARLDRYLEQACDLVEQRAQRGVVEHDGEKSEKAAEGALTLIETCLHILLEETENASAVPGLVGTVVGLLRRVGDSTYACLPAVLEARFTEVVEALLGWTLDPLWVEDAGGRVAIEEALQAWGVGSGPGRLSLWGRNLPLANSLLGAMLGGMHGLVVGKGEGGEEGGSEGEQPRLRSLAGLFIVLLSCLPPELAFREMEEEEQEQEQGEHALSSVLPSSASPFAGLVLDYLRLVCVLLPPKTLHVPPSSSSSVNDHDDEASLSVFLMRCLLKVAETLSPVALAASSSPSSCPFSFRAPFLLEAYRLGAHLCLGGNHVEADAGGAWPVAWIERGLTVHLHLLTRLLPPPSLASSSSSSLLTLDKTTLRSVLGMQPSSLPFPPPPSHFFLSSCLHLWKLRLAAYSSSSSSPSSSSLPSSSSMTTLRTLWARTFAELALRSTNKKEEGEGGREGGGEVESCAWLAEEVENEMEGGREEGVVVIDLWALSVAVAVAFAPRRDKDTAMKVEEEGEGGRLAKAQERAREASCRALRCFNLMSSSSSSFSPSSSSSPTRSFSPALQGAVVELATRLLRALSPSQKADFLPQLLEVVLPMALASVRGPSLPPSLPSSSSPPPALMMVDEVLGQVLTSPSSSSSAPTLWISPSIWTCLLQTSVALLSSSSSLSSLFEGQQQQQQQEEEEDESEATIVALGNRRAFALALLGKLLRLAPPPLPSSSSSSSSFSVKGESKRAAATAASLAKARALIVLALRDPHPRLRPLALQTLALFRLLAGTLPPSLPPSSSQPLHLPLGDVLLLQTEPVALLASPFQRHPEHVRRLFDYLVGTAGAAATTAAAAAGGEGGVGGGGTPSKIRGAGSARALLHARSNSGGATVGAAAGGGGAGGVSVVVDDEPFFQWLRSLCLEATTAVLRNHSSTTAAGAAAAGAVAALPPPSASPAVALLQSCLGETQEEGEEEEDNSSSSNSSSNSSSKNKQRQATALLHPVLLAAHRLREQASRSLSVSALWAVWELARLVVWSRLKTHVGGAGATFAALERALVKAKLELLGGGARAGGASLRRVGLLVTFLGALERHIGNAAQGSGGTDVAGVYLKACRKEREGRVGGKEGETEAGGAAAFDDDAEAEAEAEEEEAERREHLPSIRVVLPPPSKKTEAFFRANHRVCLDWLTRVRPLLTDVALALNGCHEEGAQHGLQRLTDLASAAKAAAAAAAAAATAGTPSSTSLQEVEEAAVGVALGMAEQTEEEEGVERLQGLERWLAALQQQPSSSSSSSSSSPSLLTPKADKATCSARTALRKYPNPRQSPR